MFLRHVYDYLVGSLLIEKESGGHFQGLVFKDFERFLELVTNFTLIIRGNDSNFFLNKRHA